MTPQQQAAAIIVAVQSRGSNATDLRDAVHEAHHALDGRARRWDRESIHKALMRRYRGQDTGLVTCEVMARAIEQIVCRDLGIDPGGIDGWAMTSCMEAIKHGLPHAEPKTFARLVRDAMATPEARRAADAVLALTQDGAV